jgi:dipeptidyl aminopeptidase/acylaminoacyl peptidase
MKKLLIVLWVSMPLLGVAQKPALTEADLRDWPQLTGGDLSNDGRYVAYYTPSKLNAGRLLHIQAVKEPFSMEVAIHEYSFTEDNREVIYINAGDSLCRFDLGSRQQSCLPGIRSFQVPKKGGLPLIAWQTTNDSLVLQNRITGERSAYAHVADYSFTKSGKVLLVFQQNSTVGVLVQWIDLGTGQSSIAWKGKKFLKYVTAPTDTKLAFVLGNGFQDPNMQLWEYDPQKGSTARKLVDTSTTGMEGYSVSWDQLQYSARGDRLFFGIRHLQDSVRKDPRMAPVDVWNYKDEFLQPDQVKALDAEKDRTYMAVVNGSGVLRLEQDTDGWFSGEMDEGSNGDLMLAASQTNNSEGMHDAKELPDVYLVNTRDGSRICIMRRLFNAAATFSAGGKYVVWYDWPKKVFSFYDIQTRKINTIASPVVSKEEGMFDYGRWRWLEGDKGVLMYDHYDIWLIDPKGAKAPVNVTNGYGRRNKIVLRMTTLDYSAGSTVKPGETLLLNGFSEENKDNGFFHKIIGASGDPERLSMGPYLRYFADADWGWMSKARDANTYIMKCSRADAYPNIEVTENFRTFTRVSDWAPEKKVNWLTSELVKWKTFDGRPGMGILYKPENFDPTKKYPILFYFYERLSDHLHQYIDPDWTGFKINIPWFVSHGYLIFCPDIYYTLGDPGKGIYNYIVSAAAMMKTRPWVDGGRMGFQGHSFGGFEANLLVTKTNLFAAAASAAGATDMISHDMGAAFDTFAGQPGTELGQYRMQVPVTQNLAAYIRNSAVLGADKVTTPLLIMHCKKDRAVPWEQAVEFFTALRWLGKTVYLLQYDDGGHWVSGVSEVDYTRRITQFFDHYLKGAPEPKWMSEGIPAAKKQIDDGLEIGQH